VSKQIGCPDYWIGSRRIDHVRHQLHADAGVLLAGHATCGDYFPDKNKTRYSQEAILFIIYTPLRQSDWVDSIMQCVNYGHILS